ncbi:MAG: class I SAM-dependent methyltransferase [Planctomycetota bacterium]
MNTETIDWQQETLKYDRAHDRLRFVARVLGKLPIHALLDIGCSTAKLKSLLADDVEYFGCDISDQARSRLGGGHFQRMDLNISSDFLYFAGRGINAIHVGGVVEYLERPEEMLANARELLSQGDYLVISIINFRSRKFSSPENWHPAWIYRPTLREFRHCLTNAGWEIERQLPVFRHDERGIRWEAILAKVLGVDSPWTQTLARQFLIVAKAR